MCLAGTIFIQPSGVILPASMHSHVCFYRKYIFCAGVILALSLLLLVPRRKPFFTRVFFFYDFFFILVFVPNLGLRLLESLETFSSQYYAVTTFFSTGLSDTALRTTIYIYRVFKFDHRRPTTNDGLTMKSGFPHFLRRRHFGNMMIIY